MNAGSLFAAGKPGPEKAPGFLILLATVVLAPFTYLVRVDTIGVVSASHPWTAITGGESSFWLHNTAAVIMLGLVPVLAIRLLFGVGLRDIGLAAGDKRQGVIWLAIGVPLAMLAAWLSAGQPEMRAVYPLDHQLMQGKTSFAHHALLQLLYYTGWEVLFRGVLLRGLTPRLGFATANSIQTGLSVLAHIGRPLPEIVAAIPGGLAFGGVAHRTRSVWYVVLIHWVLGMAQDAFILFG